MANTAFVVVNQESVGCLGALAQALQRANQDAVALVAVLLGALLAVRGSAVMKFLFVFVLSLAVLLRTCIAAEEDGHVGLATLLVLLVLPLVVLAADRLYLIFCSLVGAAIGASASYTCTGLVVLPRLAAGLLVSLTAGLAALAFLRWRCFGWRLLSPPLGSLLVTASLRYAFDRVLLGGQAYWLNFADEPWSDMRAFSSDFGAVSFLCAWGVLALLGWYVQFANLLGLEDPLVVPDHMLAFFDKIQAWFPFVFDGSGDPEEGMLGSPSVLVPFLEHVPKQYDSKPEVIMTLSVFSVLLLFGLLCSRPLLLLGHVVLMSCAVTLVTAGFLSGDEVNSSQHLQFGGVEKPKSLVSRLHRCSFEVAGGLAALAALGGYGCVCAGSRPDAASHPELSALDADRPIRMLHQWLGYAILGIIIVMASTGAATHAGACQQGNGPRVVTTFQRVLGKMTYAIAAATQILGYFIAGLLPLWASWLLTICLVVVAVSTLASKVLQLEAAHQVPEMCYAPPSAFLLEKVPAVDAQISFASTKLESGQSESPQAPQPAQSKRPQPQHPKKEETAVFRREKSTRRLAGALMGNLREHRRQALLTMYFGRWQRSLLANRPLAEVREAAFFGNLAKFCARSELLDIPLKAYAKLHGSYDSIEGGFVNDALVDMTGGIGEKMHLHDKAARKEINDGTMWAKLLSLAKDGHLLGCGSGSGKDTDISDMGIVKGHAYSILRVEEVEGNRLLQLRNPWGSTEWKGKWSDGDKDSWTQKMKKKLGYVNANDGSFWMAFEDFVNHYRCVYICRLFDDSWNRVFVNSEWRGETAGGCRNFPTYEKNPKIQLIVKGRVNLILTLEQADSRGGFDGDEEIPIGFRVYRDRSLSGNGVCGTSTYAYDRELCVDVELTENTAGPYIILPTAFKPNMERGFILKAFWKGAPDVVQMQKD
ncbi:Calpain-type cysteine protease ADL1 [Symbiodinium microadriaticum]|uniref:Calpain-type cysteine protease ADL1 n=1 Tax=Symbiodinium microadriaticum TaxID=2951 RepID=A0A1Q9D064_SYMMI|nr:Calpain-type cysteine protease ADL1 [Symbiodinium microadriaticum]